MQPADRHSSRLCLKTSQIVTMTILGELLSRGNILVTRNTMIISICKGYLSIMLKVVYLRYTSLQAVCASELAPDFYCFVVLTHQKPFHVMIYQRAQKTYRVNGSETREIMPSVLLLRQQLKLSMSPQHLWTISLRYEQIEHKGGGEENLQFSTTRVTTWSSCALVSSSQLHRLAK